MVSQKPCSNGLVRKRVEIFPFVWTLAFYAPRCRIPFHDHSFPGLTFVLQGSMQEGFSNRIFDAKPGMLIAKPPDAGHWDECGYKGTTCLILETPEDEELSRRVPLLRTLLLTRRAEVSRIADEVVHELEEKIPDERYLTDLAFDFLSASNLCTRGSTSKPRWFQTAMEFIQDEAFAIQSTVEVAQAAGVHPVHFTRVFRQIHGCTLKSYLTRLRLEKAALRLKVSDDPITHIALEAGFCDQAHFHRAFQKHFGRTPREYRSTSNKLQA